jgi:hypothetical protein
MANMLSQKKLLASLEEAQLRVAYYLDAHFNLGRQHLVMDYRSPR